MQSVVWFSFIVILSVWLLPIYSVEEYTSLIKVRFISCSIRLEGLKLLFGAYETIMIFIAKLCDVMGLCLLII